MKKQAIRDLITLIDNVEKERIEALLPENRKDRGYPYLCGYQYSALKLIKQTLELNA
jgi:hypothetical protein